MEYLRTRTLLTFTLTTIQFSKSTILTLFFVCLFVYHQQSRNIFYIMPPLFVNKNLNIFSHFFSTTIELQNIELTCLIL